MDKMRKLVEYILRWLFMYREGREILDDGDYDPPMIMHCVRPGEKIDREPQAANAPDELK